MSPDRDLRTPTYAIVSERAELDTEGAEWALDAFLGTVRIRAESETRRALFIGIGREDVVTAFLAGRRARCRDSPRRGAELLAAAGRRPARRPGGTIWAATASGAGEQTLEWEPEDGDWRAVVMNADASRGVSAEVAIGAELDPLLWIGIGLLVVGGLLAAGGALAITAGVHRRRAPPTA